MEYHPTQNCCRLCACPNCHWVFSTGTIVAITLHHSLGSISGQGSSDLRLRASQTCHSLSWQKLELSLLSKDVKDVLSHNGLILWNTMDPNITRARWQDTFCLHVYWEKAEKSCSYLHTVKRLNTPGLWTVLCILSMRLKGLSHLPHLLHLNCTGFCFPTWCGLFEKVWMEQSHLGAHQKRTKQEY